MNFVATRMENPWFFCIGVLVAVGHRPSDRRFFDPKVYKIILFDQRGAGKSTPTAELRENDTWALVEDMEKLREHLGVDKWLVFGGSWGSTLALVYAQTHPYRVKALVLRGIFTLRRKEILWLSQEGASHLYPDYYEKYVKPIPEGERGDLVSAFDRRFTGDDKEVQLECARAWTAWELIFSRLYVDQNLLQLAENDQFVLQFALIECHYFVNGGFFKTDSHILDNVGKIRHIPCTIIQGRHDVVCPMDTAWELHKRWPEADFRVVPDAGHAESEAGTTSELVKATDKYRDL